MGTARWLTALGLALSGCGFEHGVGASGDGGIDVPPPIDTVPATPRWIVAAISTASGSSVSVIPFTGTTFGNACSSTPISTYDVRDLAAQPSLPYAYSIEADLRGIALSCSSAAPTVLTGLGGPRPLQRIVMNAAGSVGFFTIDGPLAVGVYRFTAQADGVPAIGGSANGPGQSGAIALVESDAQLFVAGNAQMFEYDLTGPALDFPGSSTLATVCSASDLVPSGNYVLAFCSDSPDIHRYARTPFAFDSNVGSIGAVSRVVTLPGDKAVAARIAPAQLVAIDLHGGTPTWVDGPTFAGEISALAASRDGRVLVTARVVDSGTSEISVWSLTGTSFALVHSENLAGRVTALALTLPGT